MIFRREKKGIIMIFGGIDFQDLFSSLDEDQDGFLNEDEQMRFFLIINAKCFFLYQLFVYLGHYSQIKNLKKFQDKLIKLIH